MAKEKKIVKDKINWKKELKLTPGYIIILLWVAFTLYELPAVFGNILYIADSYLRTGCLCAGKIYLYRE